MDAALPHGWKHLHHLPLGLDSQHVDASPPSGLVLDGSLPIGWIPQHGDAATLPAGWSALLS